MTGMKVRLNKAQITDNFFTAYSVGSFLSTEISWEDIFPVFHKQNNPKTH